MHHFLLHVRPMLLLLLLLPPGNITRSGDFPSGNFP